MPFGLLIIGMIMIVTGIKGTQTDLGAQVVKDFTGPGNFTYWVIAILGVGALGYVEVLKPISRAFLALLIIVILLSNNGFFAQFGSALAQGTAKPPPKGDTPATIGGGDSGSGGGDSGGTGGVLDGVLKMFGVGGGGGGGAAGTSGAGSWLTGIPL